MNPSSIWQVHLDKELVVPPMLFPVLVLQWPFLILWLDCSKGKQLFMEKQLYTLYNYNILV